MDRVSQSHKTHGTMCGSGLMKHDSGTHPVTTQATDAYSNGTTTLGSSHEQHVNAN